MFAICSVFSKQILQGAKITQMGLSQTDVQPIVHKSKIYILPFRKTFHPTSVEVTKILNGYCRSEEIASAHRQWIYPGCHITHL